MPVVRVMAYADAILRDKREDMQLQQHSALARSASDALPLG
jgi:hypothetical protein